ncbi:transcriptional regulator [Clostridium aceticum]|uniref:Transcriptional regulator n=1 Tax=Clostridium aceticum TaxID=84022 RepID=A0A0D8IAL8_9CLOT|nr:GntR family transcriptional regulator [Clostridium aceticum]AKL96506.1 transcriptional regulator [Clostridium aceticum]KJF27323.1 hypothetical protein TZ02_08275 [Clostridium aceticum]
MKTKGILNTSLHSKSIVESIVDNITNAIIMGELKPGDKLPTEMELSNSMQVGRNSVREAIKKLEAYGVVYIKRAEGTFVTDSYNQKMLDPMLYGIILQENKWDDFVKLRSVVEIGTLHVVSRSRTEDQIINIKDSLTSLIKAINSPSASVEDIMEADSNFHMAITKIADNQLVETITDYITRITIPSRTLTTKSILEHNLRDEFIDLHRRFVDVIEGCKINEIEETVMQHYVYWKGYKDNMFQDK